MTIDQAAAELSLAALNAKIEKHNLNVSKSGKDQLLENMTQDVIDYIDDLVDIELNEKYGIILES